MINPWYLSLQIPSISTMTNFLPPTLNSLVPMPVTTWIFHAYIDYNLIWCIYLFIKNKRGKWGKSVPDTLRNNCHNCHSKTKSSLICEFAICFVFLLPLNCPYSTLFYLLMSVPYPVATNIINVHQPALLVSTNYQFFKVSTAYIKTLESNLMW